MIRTSTTHNLKKIQKRMGKYVLKKILDEIRRLKKTQKVTMDTLKDFKDKLVYQGDLVVDIKF